MASSLALPPAFLITCASPSARPAYFAGSKRASIQVRMAKLLPGGMERLPSSPNSAAYTAFADSTSSFGPLKGKKRSTMDFLVNLF